ncbi:MAG: helix-turn-helix transcriptional regulator [Candidatus Heimdallarchaeota archaeon]|nr:MAG: helix-turn-helix transcriptional regulator [Candidatus Heimdallarchaeota archaeon]
MAQDLEEECSALLAIKILGRKWIPWILCELLSHRESYFSDLLKRIEGNYGEKISARVLSESLTMLEENNLLERTVVSETMPVRVKYSLTEKGADLEVIFGILKGWGIRWGSIKQKKCKSFSCIHNCVPMININKAKELLEIGEPLPVEEIEDTT